MFIIFWLSITETLLWYELRKNIADLLWFSQKWVIVFCSDEIPTYSSRGNFRRIGGHIYKSFCFCSSIDNSQMLPSCMCMCTLDFQRIYFWVGRGLRVFSPPKEQLATHKLHLILPESLMIVSLNFWYENASFRSRIFSMLSIAIQSCCTF